MKDKVSIISLGCARNLVDSEVMAVEAARLKEEGGLKPLVVAGCLPQRYSKELARELPEVDLFIGTGEVARIVEILREHEKNNHRLHIGIPSYLYDHATP